MFTRTNRSGRFVALLPAAWLPLALFVTACDDDDIDIIEPIPILSGVAVFADSTFDFGALNTFVVADTVVHVTPATGTPLEVTREFDQDVINSVRQNLLARGYVEVNPDSVQPDFVALISATATRNQIAWISYPLYPRWAFFGGLNWFVFDNTWLVVYPWAPTVAVTEHPRGTLLVDLIPRLQVNPLDKTVTAAWTGVATGALTGERTAEDFDAAIDQMFVLSPYLASDTIIVTPH